MFIKKLITGILFPALALSLIGCHTASGRGVKDQPAKEVYSLDRVVEDIVYTGSEWPQQLGADLYLPRKPGLKPVVVMIHGGGWANRSRGDMAAISRKLVSHGYAVFNISYRFAPRFTYPAQFDDIRQSLKWIADNAWRYQLDLERVNTWGYSSGAHLAALTGGFNHNEPSASANLPRIRAVVAGGIPSDLRKYSGSPIVMRFMGGDRHEMPERYAEASPVYHISDDDPPVFLYHGKLDFLVSTDQATDYYDALIAQGVDAELYLQDWRGHMTMFMFGDAAENRAIGFLNRNNGDSA